MKSCPTYWAKIFVGVRPAYDQTIKESDLHNRIIKARALCQMYCDEVGLGLTLTETTFIYTKGNEPGLIIGLINYPRFPNGETNIKLISKEIAKILLKELQQERLSIMYPEETVMLEKEDL